MKKLIVAVLLLSSMVSVKAMELMRIKSEDNNMFALHLLERINAGKKMVEQNKISEGNHIYGILKKIYQDLTLSNNNLLKMIIDQGLNHRVLEYTRVDSDEVVTALKANLRSSRRNADVVASLLKRARINLSTEILRQKQPNVFVDNSSADWHVENSDNCFMINNENYLLTEDSIKDYSAFFIYQTVFASKNS